MLVVLLDNGAVHHHAYLDDLGRSRTGSHRLVAELNPITSEPGSDIPVSLFVPEIMIRRGFRALLERTNPDQRRATGPSWIHFRAQDVRNPLVERPFNWFKSPLGHGDTSPPSSSRVTVAEAMRVLGSQVHSKPDRQVEVA